MFDTSALTREPSADEIASAREGSNGILRWVGAGLILTVGTLLARLYLRASEISFPSSWMPWLVSLAVAAGFVALLLLVVHVTVNRQARRSAVYAAFAEANQLNYRSMVKGCPDIRGPLFTRGRSPFSKDVFNAAGGADPQEVGRFSFHQGYGRSYQLMSFGYVLWQMPLGLPHIIVDQIFADGRSTAPVTKGIDPRQRVTIPGLEDRFTVHAPLEAHETVRQLFTDG